MSMNNDFMDITLIESFYNPITVLEFKSDITRSDLGKESMGKNTNQHDPFTNQKGNQTNKYAKNLAEKPIKGKSFSASDKSKNDAENEDMINRYNKDIAYRNKERERKQKAAGVSGNSNDRKRERKQNG